MRFAYNSAYSVAQVLVSTAVTLGAYRQISSRLGLAELGVWSVISAVAAFGRIADLGVGISMVRLVPSMIAKGERDAAGQMVVTAVALAVLCLIVILPILFPFLVDFVALIVSETNSEEIKWILILSLAALVCNVGSSCMLGALEAIQRYDRRFLTVLISNIAFIGTVLALTPGFGLIGLALGVLVQAFVSALVGWWYVRSSLQLRIRMPMHIHKENARRILRVGGSMQVITLANLAFEPTTRLLLARFAGLEWAAIFDVAGRIVGFGRSLLMAALQVATPRMAALTYQDRERRKAIYRLIYELSCTIGLIGFGTVYLALPAIGAFVLGSVRLELMPLGGVLAAAWLLNTISAAAYFSIIGGGRLFWIVIAHLSLAVLNLAIGWWWGPIFGAPGVIAAYVVALIVGSTLNILGHYKNFGFGLLPLSIRDIVLGMIVIGILLLATFAQTRFGWDPVRHFVSVATSIGLAALGFWAVRDKITRFRRSYVANTE